MALSITSVRACRLAAINGFLAVLIGAFGAHVLETRISPRMLEVFNTGIQYHMFHVVALLATALVARMKGESRRVVASMWAFLVGIILFSGSLYALALTGIGILGAITPLGGLAFLAGWALLFVEMMTTENE